MPSPIEQAPPLVTEDEKTFKELSGLVSTHLPQHPFLKLAEYDSNKSLHQLKTTFIEAQPTDIDTIIEITEGIQPGFYENMVKPFLEEEKQELLKDIASKLDAGEDIALITDHESLLDIILVILALNVALAKRGLVEFEEQTLHTDLILSRTILCLEIDNNSDENIDNIPAAEMIRLLGNLHFSLPDSERIRQSDISDDITNANNLRMLRKLTKLLKHSERGRVVAIAAPGTVGQRYTKLDGELHYVVIDQVSQKTIKLIKRLKTALPVMAVLEGENQCCVPGELTKISDDRDVHEMMREIAEARQRATGVPTWYKKYSMIINKMTKTIIGV